MTITLTKELAAAALPGVQINEWQGPRYNLAPTQPVPALLNRDPSTVQWLRWNLRAGQGAPLINARAETLADQPTFRKAFARQRCLVLADGFYEWPQLGGRSNGGPYYFQLRDQPLMAFAGIWDLIHGADGREHESCAIITTAANDLLRPLHARMPVILPQEHHNRWLDPREVEPATLAPLLVPFPAVSMTARRTSARVNQVRHDDPMCLAPPQPDPQKTLPGFEADH
jgi:putative SOS response-associated peptidase YedK